MKYLKNAHGRVIVVDSKRARKLLSEPGFSVATEEEAIAWQEEHLKHLKKAAPTEEEESEDFVEELRVDIEALTKTEIVEFAASTYKLEIDPSLTKGAMVDQVVAFVRENEGV